MYNSTGKSGVSVFPNNSNLKNSDSCFICCKTKTESEFANAALDMKGIPNTNEDKLNILQVICQLLRVRWELIESVFKSHPNTPVNFPFCLGCLKCVTEIICLREQLCQIESDIRNKIRIIETSVAQCTDPLTSSKIGNHGEDTEQNLEPPESYEGCRQLFQTHVMQGILKFKRTQNKLHDKLPKKIFRFYIFRIFEQAAPGEKN